jgi:enterochelin esterase family protein
VAYTAPQCINWYSEHLHNTRRVWVYTTGEVFDPAERPLAILLDGEFWAQSMPVWPVLQSLTLAGQLPAAVYLLVDAIDTAHRSRELPCNPDFWLAVKNDLLPRIAQLAPFNPDAQHTVVAGQSFGGLASLYAALHWPEHFGCALSLSGSYWWPNRGETVDGELIHQVQSGQLPTGSPRIILEAGLREPLIFRASQAMYTQLQHAQYNVLWRQFDGGHDAFCWRGGLTSGLTTLWAPLLGQ